MVYLLHLPLLGSTHTHLPPLYHPWCSPWFCSWSSPFQYIPPPHVPNLYRLSRHFLSYLRRWPSTLPQLHRLPHSCSNRLSSCINSIHQWITSNFLKLNLTKTEAIFLHLPLRSSTLPEPPPILLNMNTFPYSKHISNLGLHIDSTLSLDTNISHMHKYIHYHLHCFRIIRRSIPFPIAVTIASSYILPIFDYCNNLLFNLPAYKLIKLQRLQNAVVRCVHLLPRRSSDSIAPLLKQLHRLPVSNRIKYKLSLEIHKAIHHNSPDNLAPLLHLHTLTTPIHTRSSNTFILTTPHLNNLHSSHIRSFDLSAPYHWNSLSYNLRTITSTSSFKRHLNTYVYTIYPMLPPTQ